MRVNGSYSSFIVFGEELRLPTDLLDSPQTPVYNVDDYGRSQLKVFSDIHREVKQKLQESKTAMSVKQHKHAQPVELQAGDSVMVQIPERRSKLSPKFTGPRLIIKKLHGNKFEVFDPMLNTLDVVHCDRLKPTKVKTNLTLAKAAHLAEAVRRTPPPIQSTNTHTYNLRSRNTPPINS